MANTANTRLRCKAKAVGTSLAALGYALLVRPRRLIARKALALVGRHAVCVIRALFAMRLAEIISHYVARLADTNAGTQA